MENTSSRLRSIVTHLSARRLNAGEVGAHDRASIALRDGRPVSDFDRRVLVSAALRSSIPVDAEDVDHEAIAEYLTRCGSSATGSPTLVLALVDEAFAGAEDVDGSVDMEYVDERLEQLTAAAARSLDIRRTFLEDCHLM